MSRARGSETDKGRAGKAYIWMPANLLDHILIEMARVTKQVSSDIIRMS